MVTTISIPKQEYDELVNKANLFDHFIETEDLTDDELVEIQKASKGPFVTKKQFLKRHPELD